MIRIPRDAAGSVACGRSGRPLLAICANRHKRLVPFRRLKTSAQDRTPIYGRPYRCPECASPEVKLFDIESQAELDAIQGAVGRREPRPVEPHSTHRPPDPDADRP